MILLTIIYTVGTLHKKRSFPLKIFSVKWQNLQETADLVTFTKEILVQWQLNAQIQSSKR